MSDFGTRRIGGCLCGAVRYEAEGEPLSAGYCYCADCRKASGSGFIPFMLFPSSAVRLSGAVRQTTSRAANGGDAVRSFCASCGGLVFGGTVGKDDAHTIYAGSLDDPSTFRPKVAIFARDRPAWAAIPPGITIYDAMPN